MADPISATAGAVDLAQDFWRFVTFLKGVVGADVISALFKWDATRVVGSEKIVVRQHRNDGAPEVWWYEVEALNDYTFLRFPVVQSCTHELVGLPQGQKNADARYWRWVPQERQGVIVGGQVAPPNVMVDFIIVGYRPKALIKHLS